MRLLPYSKSIRKRQRQNPKFYLFDLGVQAALTRNISQPLSVSTYNYGNLFEQFLILEVFRLMHYHEKEWRLSYLRTQEGVEIDLIVERPGEKTICIEVKSTNHVKAKDLKSLKALGKDIGDVELLVLSNTTQAQLLLSLIHI